MIPLKNLWRILLFLSLIACGIEAPLPTLAPSAIPIATALKPTVAPPTAATPFVTPTAATPARVTPLSTLAPPTTAVPTATTVPPTPMVAPPSPRAGSATPATGSSGFRIVYQTNFQSEIDPGLMLQEPTTASMTIGSAPCQPPQRALRVSIQQQDDYSRVANGVPRAEISFAGRFVFESGREYLVRWSTCLPVDFQFDSKQPEGIGQIHEGAPQGSPPWGMTLAGGHYQVELRDGSRVQTRDIGSAAQDRGRWVQWTLHYRPDSSGASAITELTKDGAQVLSANGIPNAYPNDSRAYFKIGIYKWWWKERPSDVSDRTMFFGDVVVEVR